MIDFRTNCQSWYQVPIVYVWHDIVVAGTGPAPTPAAAPAAAGAAPVGAAKS